MEKCIDAGEIQAFLDGELASDLSERVARHVTACDACAIALAEAEDESAFAFSLIEQELNTLVPTQRLWTKINESIEQSKKKTVWESAFANFKLFFGNHSTAAFAGLLIVCGVFVFVKNLRLDESAVDFAQNQKLEQIVVSPQTVNKTALPFREPLVSPSFVPVKKSPPPKEANNKRIIKTALVKSGETKRNDFQPNRQKHDFIVNIPAAIPAENLPGEETYIKTIAALEKTVDGRKDEILKPSARFAFEKDLAVADDAIAKMKSEVVKNPKNAAAKQILIASYRNKIELLASVAEKNDLMASLR